MTPLLLQCANSSRKEIDMPNKSIAKIKGGNAERRVVTVEGLEVRAAADVHPASLAGYAALYNTLSDDLGGFVEQIAPGAFAKSIGGDVRALFNHDPNLVLGRTKAKTLGLSDDQKGLKFEIQMPNTSAARDLMESIERHDVDQMSFGFKVVEDFWEEVGGNIVRTLIEVDLFDVSPVTFPAYPDTGVAIRSMNQWKKKIEDERIPDYTSKLKLLDLMSLE